MKTENVACFHDLVISSLPFLISPSWLLLCWGSAIVGCNIRWLQQIGPKKSYPHRYTSTSHKHWRMSFRAFLGEIRLTMSSWVSCQLMRNGGNGCAMAYSLSKDLTLHLSDLGYLLFLNIQKMDSQWRKKHFFKLKPSKYEVIGD